MYTVVPRPEIFDHRTDPGQKQPEVIDHRNNRFTKWKDRSRPEQLPYDTLKKQRDALLIAEIQYKKRIKVLEDESNDLVKTYEKTYEENKVLKSIIEYGPDAAKLKQLNKDKREQKGIIEQLEEDNKKLTDQLNNLEKKFGILKDTKLEEGWKEALAKARKRREEEDSIPTQGPFASGSNVKSKRVSILDDKCEDQRDAYDLQLDNLEKETQILINKIRQLKKEKEQIDWATAMGKGAVIRNVTVQNAINEKLNRDLNKFAIRLEKLKIKYNAGKTYSDLAAKRMEMISPNSKLEDVETDETKDQESPESETPIRSHKKIPSSRTRSQQKSRNTVNNSSRASNNAESIKEEDNKSQTGRASQQNNSSRRSSKQIQDDKKEESNEQQKDTRAKGSASQARENNTNQPGAVKANSAHKPSTALTTGRYSHGPEPIKRGKGKKTDEEYVAKTDRSSDLPKLDMPLKSARKQSKPDSQELTYDDVLRTLPARPGQQTPKEQDIHKPKPLQRHAIDQHLERKWERNAQASPIPIEFKSNGQTLDGKELKLVLGNSGLRTNHIYKVY